MVVAPVPVLTFQANWAGANPCGGYWVVGHCWPGTVHGRAPHSRAEDERVCALCSRLCSWTSISGAVAGTRRAGRATQTGVERDHMSRAPPKYLSFALTILTESLRR